MQKQKDYPKWFSIHSKPRKPNEPKVPEEEKRVRQTVYLGEGDCEISNEKLRELADKGSSISVNYYHEWDDSECTVYEVIDKIAPNPNYKKQLKRYENNKFKFDEKMKAHRQKLREWNELNKKWKAEEKEELEKAEREQLAQLKAKYEKIA